MAKQPDSTGQADSGKQDQQAAPQSQQAEQAKQPDNTGQAATPAKPQNHEKPKGPGPEVEKLTEHLRETGTGESKLKAIQRYRTAQEAIQHLRARGLTNTAKKAEAWLNGAAPKK